MSVLRTLSLDPDISNFTVAPTIVAVLESTCPDSDPHDSFTLVCRAMKPSVVIPELMVQWLYNGSIRAGDISVTNNGTYVVNTLNVNNAQVNDSGVYRCVATIVIPDSPIVTTNANSMVTSRRELLFIIRCVFVKLVICIMCISCSLVSFVSLNFYVSILKSFI